METNMNDIYQYSTNLNLINYIKEIKDENNRNNASSESIKKNEFLFELANILENKLKTNIRLHQKGFEIYKEKMLNEKNLILNSMSENVKNLTINQLITELNNIKKKKKQKEDIAKEFFNVGQKKNNNNKINIDQSAIETINKIFQDKSINNNNGNNNINNNYNNKNHHFDPRVVYHSRSPSPNINKQYNSKIIEENKNVNNLINFYEDQKIK